MDDELDDEHDEGLVDADELVDLDDLPEDVAALVYEQAREELLDVVRRLESGGATLEESLALWERGEALATRCEQWLAGARARVDEAVSRRAAPDR